MTTMMELDNLARNFGRIEAVKGISLTVAKGEVLGFLGPNGAGKSTTMKMIAGYLEPTAGTARVCGFDVVDHPVEVKKRIGYLPEGAPAYGDMTPAAFLDFTASVRGLDNEAKRRVIGEIVEKVDLEGVLSQPIDTLSKGYKRRVGLAQAMLHDPRALILDEPTDGLDPNQKHQVRNLIKEMAKDKAIIVSTHILEEVEAVCTRAVIIADGRLVADGTPDELLARAEDHNAVVVSVAAGDGGRVKEELGRLECVKSAEIAERGDGVEKIRLLPRDGRAIGIEVGRLIVSKSLPVSEFFVEKGGLDAVFRRITTANDDAASSAGEAQSDA